MLIEGPLNSGKTQKLIETFIELVKSGVSTSEILFLCANGYKKKILTEKIRERLAQEDICGISALPVYTFNGIVYNSIVNNWPLIEECIPEAKGKITVLPELSSLETTQYLLKKSIDQSGFSDYFSKNNLLHQLLRRYRLISENCLSESEVEDRSKILKEEFAQNAKKALNLLKDKTNTLRCFDYLKQTNTFLYLLNNDKIKDFDNIQYFFADDIDELSFAAFTFISKVLEKSKNFYLAADSDGGARRGYLCAYSQGWDCLKTKLKVDIVTLDCSQSTYGDALALFANVKYGKKNKFEHIQLSDSIKRAEMLEHAISRVEALICSGVEPSQINIITPSIDENIKYTLIDFFEQKKIKYQFLSGSKKLFDDPIVSACLLIAQLINKEWKLKPSVFEIRLLLNNVLGIPVAECKEALERYQKTKKLNPDVTFGHKEFNEKYSAIVKVIEELSENKTDLGSQLLEIFNRVVICTVQENTNLQNFNDTLKSLDSFQKLLLKIEENKRPEFIEKEWILQIKNTVVSDNMSSSPDISGDSLIIATPQMIIDYEIQTDYQIWLDVSSRYWVKEDTGPLYNAWVMQKNWGETEYTPAIHNKLTNEKTAHVIRKLVLCSNEKIYAYSSQLDSSGNENIGNLQEFIDTSKSDNSFGFKNITPREDQLPVLSYKSRKMAVPAVPGAGKTTIMQALIIELLKRGTEPSQILVLTYMESAARNFLDRIKKSCPGLNDLPHISTIHSLAYKIILEESNYTKLGLDSDFRICDDIERPRIIREISLKHLPFGEDESKWSELNATAISRIKIARITPETLKTHLKNRSDQQLEEFLPVFDEYTKTLRQKNIIDYDDLLVMATTLLKEHKDIRNYYQDKFEFVIEDEAQDSSALQQEFISILSAKSGNLIRCGDVNQAITTTFSNADVKGFKDFIEKNPKVEMQSSQRCAKDVYELANYLVDWSKQNVFTKNAFYDIKMKPVVGANPVAKHSLNFKILQTPEDEKKWVLKEIRSKLSQNPDQTFGVLLRTNWQVFEWANFLENNGIKTLCRTDTLKQKKVFKFILKLLEVLNAPWNNTLCAELYEEFALIKRVKRNDFLVEFIKSNLGTPLVCYQFGTNDIPQLEQQDMANFWWDIYYWLENSYLPPEELVIRIGNYYFNNVLDRSNAHLLAILIKKFSASFSDNADTLASVKLPEIIRHFKELQNKNKISGVKFFSEEDSSKDKALDGYVQLMTLHKAKGDEFGTVFIPEMYENSYAIEPDSIKIKPENMLIEKLTGLVADNSSKTKHEIIAQQIEETLRLVYVGITRAEKYLYMSSPKTKTTKYGKSYDVAPSRLLEHFISSCSEKSGLIKHE